MFAANAARSLIARAPAAAARRTFSAENNLKLRGVRRADDHKVWAREVGAYPIIGILSFAVGFCAWRCTKCATECSDVRWVPSKRQQLIRTWDDTK